MKLYLPTLVAAVIATLYAGVDAVPKGVSGINYDARNGSDWETNNASCKSFTDVYHEMLTLQTFTEKVRTNSLIECDVANLVLQFASSIGVTEKVKLGEIIDKGRFDTVTSVHVGNGAISRDNVTVDTALEYMTEIRDFLRGRGKNASVTIADSIEVYNTNPKLLEAVDYVSVGYSPFWERVDVNEGVAVTLDRMKSLRIAAENKDKPVVIDTAWSSGGMNPIPDLATPKNQAKYFSDFIRMAHSHKDLDYYWSDAFDAKWLNDLDIEAHLGVYEKAGVMKEEIFNLQFENWRAPRLIRTEGSIMLSEADDKLYMSEKSNNWLTQEQQTWFFDETTQQIRSKSSDRCLDAYQPCCALKCI
ncbi:putative endo-1,3-beta glucanase [Phytophthora sojae]|uniref:glucan endo-1,3-beta-D-glucosidase n=1 Tax=Phytophthora sojae (strain P6497) TaxID=1094619 RepID=G4YZ38_PHYSP|nr:putative endo-1,3-beta glucanase [Phytophthora sojae]EGZ23319.1 putative endo-1,3-beta glucanase [Phytophthora sojae]|eukprot:XP_009518607.1 putative endo-1,3-beta glucanase [Phytophthora sojae]